MSSSRIGWTPQQRIASALERLANVAELHALRSVPLSQQTQDAIKERQLLITGPVVEEPTGLDPDYADSAE